MGLFEFIAGGLAANAASNRLKPPTVTCLDGKIIITGVEPANISASSWKVHFYKKGSPNCTYSHKISRSTSGFHTYGSQCKVFWPK